MTLSSVSQMYIKYFFIRKAGQTSRQIIFRSIALSNVRQMFIKHLFIGKVI